MLIFSIHVRFVTKYDEPTRSYQVSVVSSEQCRIDSFFFLFVSLCFFLQILSSWNCKALRMNLFSSLESSLLPLIKMFFRVARVHSKCFAMSNFNRFEHRRSRSLEHGRIYFLKSHVIYENNTNWKLFSSLRSDLDASDSSMNFSVLFCAAWKKKKKKKNQIKKRKRGSS